MEQEIKQEQMYSKKFNTDGMTQDKTLRELFRDYWLDGRFSKNNAGRKMQEVADFYEDKIKSVVREMKKMVGTDIQDISPTGRSYNQFGDDLLERLGIK